MLTILSLENYRNFESAELQFSPGLNIIIGDNGTGKSNLLEAVHLCGFGRSFRGHGQTFLRFGAPFSRIYARNEDRNEIEIIFPDGAERKISFNGKPLPRIAELLGKFPMTYIGPGEVMLVAGSPSVRRKLIDSHLCQFAPEYTDWLYQYRHSVRQRNASLRAVANEDIAGGTVLIDAWDEKVAELGEKIIAKRIGFIKNLSPLASDMFSAIAGDEAKKLSVEYECTVAENPAVADIREIFLQKLLAHRNYDFKFFQTTIGPHRDDIKISLDNLPAKLFASWGQVRMISLALYLGALQILSEHSSATPTLLLDDALAELDPKRSRTAMEIFPKICQTLVATPHPDQVKDVTNAKIFQFTAPGVVREMI